MKKIIYSFLTLITFIILVRSGSFLYQSLDWNLAYCVDMVLMKFFAWSLDRGAWPYTDIYTYNLPMTIYINWVALKIFGDSSWGFRLLDVSWLFFLSIVTFFYLKNKIKTTILPILGASLCLTLSENATNFGAFQRETMMLPFWILSVYSYDQIRVGKSKKLHGFLMGFYICFSALIKPTGVLILLFILFAIFFEELNNKKFILKETLNFYWFIFIGGIIILFLTALPFLIHGTLIESIQNWYSYFKDLSSSLEIIPPLTLIKDIFTLLPQNWFIPLNEPSIEFQTNGHFSLFHLFILCFYVYLLLQKKVDFGPFMIFLGGFLNFVIQAKGFAYHLFPMWFGFLLFIVFILDFLYLQILESLHWKRSVFVLIFTIIGITIIIQQSRSLKFYKGTGFYTGFGQKEKKLPRVAVLDAIKELEAQVKIKPTKIQVFEAYHSITLNPIMEENMQLVSKYPEAYIFYNNHPGMEKYKIDMLKSLEKEKPNIVVINQHGTFQTKKNLFESFPALDSFLKNYTKVQEIREINNVLYQIYLLN